MATSVTHRGWKYDPSNGRLQALFNGTEILSFDTNDVAIAKAATFSAALTAESGVVVGVTGCEAGQLSLVSTGNCGGLVVVTTAACSSWQLTLPTNDGNCGQQLTTNGSGVTSWAAACSTAASKDILGITCKGVAYEQIRNAPIYDFEYKPGRGFKATHPYTGIVAEESPWAMQGGENHIFSPINAFGKLTAAFQVLAEKVEKLEARA